MWCFQNQSNLLPAPPNGFLVFVWLIPLDIFSYYVMVLNRTGWSPIQFVIIGSDKQNWMNLEHKSNLFLQVFSNYDRQKSMIEFLMKILIISKNESKNFIVTGLKFSQLPLLFRTKMWLSFSGAIMPYLTNNIHLQ